MQQARQIQLNMKAPNLQVRKLADLTSLLAFPPAARVS